MSDLSNSIFYKIKFQISSDQPDTDLVQLILRHVQRWQTKKWNRRSQILPEDNSAWDALLDGGILKSLDKNVQKRVYIESASLRADADMPYWACRIAEHPETKKEYASRDWITEIGVEPVEKGRITFSCVISYADRAGFIGQCEEEPKPNVPNLIRNVLRDPSISCTYGGDTVFVEPIPLKAGEWVSFWEKALDKERTVPYIYVSLKHDTENDEWSYPVDPKALATAAGGNALVFYEQESGVIEEMNYFCPPEYKCYGGAIRVYFRGIRMDDTLDQYRHRFIDTRMIDTFGADAIVQMIRRALAQDVHFYESFFRIDDCRRRMESFLRHERQKELQQKYEEEKRSIEARKDEEILGYFDLANEEEKKRLEIEELFADLSEELKSVKEAYYNLSEEVESYRMLSAENAELKRVCSHRFAVKTYPKTVSDIVRFFTEQFSDRIAFSDDGMKTLKYCTIPPEELWKALYALSTKMWELKTQGSGDIYAQFKQTTGITVGRGEGANTHKNAKQMRQFSTYYKGEEIDIEPHITYSEIGQTIHFGFSVKEQKIVIGSCGEHKEIYSSQKI